MVSGSWVHTTTAVAKVAIPVPTSTQVFDHAWPSSNTFKVYLPTSLGVHLCMHTKVCWSLTYFSAHLICLAVSWLDGKQQHTHPPAYMRIPGTYDPPSSLSFPISISMIHHDTSPSPESDHIVGTAWVFAARIKCWLTHRSRRCELTGSGTCKLRYRSSHVEYTSGGWDDGNDVDEGVRYLDGMFRSWWY